MFTNELWNKPPATTASFYDYQITKSLRSNSADSAYLHHTPSGSSTNRKKWTCSFWFKNTLDTTEAYGPCKIFACPHSGTNNHVDSIELYIGSGHGANGIFQLKVVGKGGLDTVLTTKHYMRDPTGWFHVYVSADSTQSTASDRMNIYLNGNLITDFATETYATQNFEWGFGSAQKRAWFRMFGGSYTTTCGGYLSEAHFIDGSVEPLAKFGAFKNGAWTPVEVTSSTVTYGNNGFALQFLQTGTNQDSSGIGADTSGNNHHFASVNFASHDVVSDTPTSNLCIQNPIANPYGVTISEGGLKTAGGWVKSTYGTISINSVGSWYWEYITDNYVYAFGGLQSIERTYYESGHTHNIDFSFVQAGEMRYDGSNEANLQTIGTGDIIGVWVNDGQIKIYKNNSLIHTYSQQLIAGRDYFPTTHGTSNTFINYGADSSFVGNKTSGSANASDANGHGDFYYEPKGLALCAQNTSIPDAIDPNLTDDDHPSKLVKSLRYTGNDGTQTIAMGFKPDWLMLNMLGSTGGGYGPQVWDTTRGDDYYIYPAGTAASVTSGSDYVEFVSTGFKLDNNWDGINHSGETYGAIGIRANGGTTSTNSTGDINTTVQVDPSGHFSIATWTGSGTSGDTIGHGLSSAPTYTVIKQTGGGTNGWNVWATGNNSGDIDSFGEWNNSGAWNQNQGSNGPFTAAPTSSVLTLTNYGQVNASSKPYIGYFFANCSNYIKSGVYKGNANATNSPIIYTGFRPEWLLIRYTGSGESWINIENASMPYNSDRRNYRFGSYAESTGSTYEIDLLSNGFKPRTTWEGLNGNNYEIVYLAIGQPFKYGTAV